MNRKWLLGAGFGALLICVVGVEIGFVTGKAEILVLLASALTALLYSVMKPRKEAAMGGSGGGQTSVEIETPLGKGKASGLGNGGVLALILGLTLAQAWFIYDMRQMMQRVIDSNDALLFAMSLSEAERQKLNIAMPESLRRKIRQRE